MRCLEFRNREWAEKALFRFRELIRGNTYWEKMPLGPGGLTVEDLDLIVRWYGPNFNLDEIGRYRLIELKHYRFHLGTSKRMLFGQMVTILYQNDPRFDGIFVVVAHDDRHDISTTYEVHGEVYSAFMTSQEFRDWILTPYSYFPGIWSPDLLTAGNQ